MEEKKLNKLKSRFFLLQPKCEQWHLPGAIHNHEKDWWQLLSCAQKLSEIKCRHQGWLATHFTSSPTLAADTE